MSVHYDLESRYRRLLRFYPRKYRTERGNEIVDTYMEMAPPDRDKPRPTDIADIAKAGLRQRLRDSPTGFDDGLRIAAIVAMCAIAFLGTTGSAIRGSTSVDTNLASFLNAGPMLMSTLWLIVAIGAPWLPVKLARVAVGTAMTTSLMLAFVPLFTNNLIPELKWLAAQLICGTLALAWPRDPRWWTRGLPLVTAATAFAAVGAAFPPQNLILYGNVDKDIIHLGFFLVAGVGLMVAAIAKRAPGLWWAVALLAVPGALLAGRPVFHALAINQLASGTGTALTLTIGLLVVGIAIPASGYAIASRKQGR